VHLCGVGTDLLGRHGMAVCESVPGEEIEVLVAVKTASVLAVEQRILAASPSFPNVAPGTLVESDTFSGR
jgi:hypothetical protein